MGPEFINLQSGEIVYFGNNGIGLMLISGEYAYENSAVHFTTHGATFKIPYTVSENGGEKRYSALGRELEHYYSQTGAGADVYRSDYERWADVDTAELLMFFSMNNGSAGCVISFRYEFSGENTYKIDFGGGLTADVTMGPSAAETDGIELTYVFGAGETFKASYSYAYPRYRIDLVQRGGGKI